MESICNQARWSNSFLAVSPKSSRLANNVSPYLVRRVYRQALCARRAGVPVEVPLFTFCPVWFRSRPPVPARPHRLRRNESQPLGTLTGVFETVNSACFDSGVWRYFSWVDWAKGTEEIHGFFMDDASSVECHISRVERGPTMAVNNTRWMR